MSKDLPPPEKKKNLEKTVLFDNVNAPKKWFKQMH